MFGRILTRVYRLVRHSRGGRGSVVPVRCRGWPRVMPARDASECSTSRLVSR